MVALHPGAKDPSRRWPPDHFAALGDALALRYGARLLLTGTAGERSLTAAIGATLQAPALDLAGVTDLGTFAALIARCDLLVTNDTGASHLAAAARTPSVVLFGPSRPSRWAPLDRDRHLVVDAADFDLTGDLSSLPTAPVLAACERQVGSRGAIRHTLGPPPRLSSRADARNSGVATSGTSADSSTPLGMTPNSTISHRLSNPEGPSCAP